MAAALIINMEHNPQKEMITLNVKEIIAPTRMGMMSVKEGSWLYDMIVRVSLDVFRAQHTFCPSS